MPYYHDSTVQISGFTAARIAELRDELAPGDVHGRNVLTRILNQVHCCGSNPCTCKHGYPSQTATSQAP